jgi:arylsulfatase A-like enzyme
MGWQDCSVPFYKEVTSQKKLFYTPNMERLASQRMKFTNAYANQNCTPIRVSLIGGMNVIRNHVNNYTQSKDKSPEQSKLFKPINWNMKL